MLITLPHPSSCVSKTVSVTLAKDSCKVNSFIQMGQQERKENVWCSSENPVHVYVLFGILSVQPLAFVQSPCCHPCPMSRSCTVSNPNAKAEDEELALRSRLWLVMEVNSLGFLAARSVTLDTRSQTKQEGLAPALSSECR